MSEEALVENGRSEKPGGSKHAQVLEAIEDDGGGAVARKLASTSSELAKSPGGAGAIAEDVRQVWLSEQTPPFDKRRQIADLVRANLLQRGELVRTPAGCCYFPRSDRRLMPIGGEPFQDLLMRSTGLGRHEGGGLLQFVRDQLRLEAQNKPLTPVHGFSFYDPVSGLLVVSNGGGGAWRLEPGGAWERCSNGDDGIYFLADAAAELLEPEFTGENQEHLTWFLQQLPFGEGGRLGADVRRRLFLCNLMHLFFPPLRRTRLIAAFLGPPGSGKTTAARLTGRLLLGSRFEVSDVSRGGRDAFVAAISNRLVLALDNVDGRIPWLDNDLARYATGVRFLDQRHSINRSAELKPRTELLMITSCDAYFRRGDIAERVLPFLSARPQNFVREHELYAELERRRNAIWGDLFYYLAAAADETRNRPPQPVSSRMADFGVFVKQTCDGACDDALRLLELEQADFASEGDDMIAVLRLLVDLHGKIGPITTSELYARCKDVAEPQHLALPRNLQAFGQRLRNFKRVIELQLNVRVKLERRHANARYVTIVRNQPVTPASTRSQAPSGKAGEEGEAGEAGEADGAGKPESGEMSKPHETGEAEVGEPGEAGDDMIDRLFEKFVFDPKFREKILDPAKAAQEAKTLSRLLEELRAMISEPEKPGPSSCTG